MYSNLKAEMARKQLKIEDLMKATGKCRGAVSNNLNGRGHFTADDAINIKNKCFPGLTIEYLFTPDQEDLKA